jgi:hypothetical protein
MIAVIIIAVSLLYVLSYFLTVRATHQSFTRFAELLSCYWTEVTGLRHGDRARGAIGAWNGCGAWNAATCADATLRFHNGSSLCIPISKITALFIDHAATACRDSLPVTLTDSGNQAIGWASLPGTENENHIGKDQPTHENIP